jgi:hypothetical protein
MTIHTKTLAQLKQNQTLVDLYREGLSEDEITGVISDYSDTFVYLSLFRDNGQEDGVAIVLMADVTRLRWGSNALLSISELVLAKKSVPTSPPLDLSCLSAVMASVQKAFGHVALHTEQLDDDQCFIGEISEMDDQNVVLHAYGTMGSRARDYTFLNLENITRIDAGGDYEKGLHFLFSK